MVKSLIDKYIYLFRLEYLNLEKKLSDDKLMPKLRSVVHALEKRNIEEETDFLRLIRARKYYYEAKRRDLISAEEKDWCENVLFGRPKERKSTPRKTEPTSCKFSDVLKKRRSVRIWQKGELEEEIFKELVEAAKWAPSSCNRQPWHFIVTRNEDKIRLLYEVKGQKFLKEAPNVILVLINKNAWSNEESYEYFSGLDAGAAIENLLLKAEELGLGACWVNWKPTSVSEQDKERIKKEFNIPNHLEVKSIIPIGEIDEKPSPPGRKDTNEFLDFEKYSH